jgi:superoxide dismutase, Cu-Zn family
VPEEFIVRKIVTLMLALVCLFLCLSGRAFAQDSKSHKATKPLVVDIRNAQEESVGTATLSSDPGGVRIKLDIKNLPPGQHSMHIHQLAKCDAPDFKSAGPHFNAAGHTGQGSMSGDIPNFFLIVGDDHTAHVTVVAPNVTMGKGENSVFTNGGTALVIHASEGGAPGTPARIACGVITAPESPSDY